MLEKSVLCVLYTRKQFTCIIPFKFNVGSLQKTYGYFFKERPRSYPWLTVLNPFNNVDIYSVIEIIELQTLKNRRGDNKPTIQICSHSSWVRNTDWWHLRLLRWTGWNVLSQHDFFYKFFLIEPSRSSWYLCDALWNWSTARILCWTKRKCM